MKLSHCMSSFGLIMENNESVCLFFVFVFPRIEIEIEIEMAQLSSQYFL